MPSSGEDLGRTEGRGGEKRSRRETGWCWGRSQRWEDIRDWSGEEVSLGEGRTPVLRRKGQRRWWLQTDNAGVQNCISHSLWVPRRKGRGALLRMGSLMGKGEGEKVRRMKKVGTKEGDPEPPG